MRDGLGDEATRILLNDHKLEDITFLIDSPLFIKLPKEGGKLLLLASDVLDGKSSQVFVGEGLEFAGKAGEEDAEGAEGPIEVFSIVENVLGEDVLLSVDPQEGEGLLGAVKDLWQETAVLRIFLALVEDLIGFGELKSVVLLRRLNLQNLDEVLYADQVRAAGRGS